MVDVVRSVSNHFFFVVGADEEIFIVMGTLPVRTAGAAILLTASAWGGYSDIDNPRVAGRAKFECNRSPTLLGHSAEYPELLAVLSCLESTFRDVKLQITYHARS